MTRFKYYGNEARQEAQPMLGSLPCFGDIEAKGYSEKGYHRV